MSEENFNELLMALRNGNSNLFEEIFLNQFEETMQYITRKFSTSREDAYDATMDGLLKFRKRLIEGKIVYGNLRFLFTQIANQMYLDNLRKHKLNDPIEDSFDLSSEEEQKIEPDTMEELNLAWAKMCSDCQRILQSFYYKGISLNDLAEQLTKSPAAIRKRKQRCLESLRDYYLNNKNLSK